MKAAFADLSPCRRQDGSTVLVLITLLAIMVMLATANSKALFHLHREIKLLETRQVGRLNASQTNAVTAAQAPVGPESK
jgi:Tfp pilus assembly protein FimT